MLSASTVLAPLFVEVALTFGLLLWFGWHRVQAVKSGSVHPRDVVLRQPNWPHRTLQIGNAYQNQLELPILFYLIIALMLVTATASPTLVILAWVFVATRLVHALIHVTTNHLSRRFFWFLGGGGILILMWLIFAWRILFGV